MSIKNIPTNLKRQDSRSSLKSSSGQALIETILLLVVGIALALILLNSFFGSAFEDWGENQFGSYLQCLLESGELPALGGGAGACSNEYVAFGQGSGNGQGPGGPGSGDGAPGSGDGESGDGDGRAGAPDRVPVASGASGRGRRGGAGRFRMGSFGSGPGGADGEGGGGGQKKESSTYTGSTEAGLPSWATQGEQRTVIRKRSQRFEDYGSFYTAEQQKEKEEGEAVTLNKEKVNSGDAQRPQAMVLKKRAPTSAPPPDDDDEWTFGAFIKYIIIIAIIIGIILFLGSQLLQIKNSMD